MGKVIDKNNEKRKQKQNKRKTNYKFTTKR